MTPVNIDIIYEAKTPLGADLNALVTALQIQVSRDFAPAWSLGCNLQVQPYPRNGVQRLIFLDNADQADALGYHELTPDGLPQGKVFVKTTLGSGEDPCVTASHELLEMLADPTIDQTAYRAAQHTRYALEVCDAVEETTYQINGLAVSNFQLPAWFDREPVTSKLDYLGKCTRPWQMLKGGYMSIQLGGTDWTQIFGSLKAADGFRSSKKWRPQVRESGIKVRSTR